MTPKEPEYIGPRPDRPLRVPAFRPRLPVQLSARAVSVLLVLLLFAIPYWTFLEYVHPNEVGIMELRVGPNRGVQSEVHGPGLKLVLPFVHRMHRLPKNVQVLELTQPDLDTAARPSASVYHERPAKIQTSDGFFVDVDASILYRIDDPYKVITTLGPGTMYLHQGVLPKAEPVLKQALGELTTEEFYKSPLRMKKAELARELLDRELQPKGIHVEQVLVRYFHYTDRIQQNIEEKKLQDQLVFTNQSKRKAAEEEQNLNRVTKQGEVEVLVTMQEADSYKVMKEADKDLYKRRKEAEADLLVELAEAERSRLRNDAMQVAGAERLVAMRMAEVLEGLETVVLPTGGEGALNPLDLQGVLELFGAAGVDDGALLKPEERGAAPQPAPSEIQIEQLKRQAEESVQSAGAETKETAP